MKKTAKIGIEIREPVTEGVTGVIWTEGGKERQRAEYQGEDKDN